LKSILFGPEIEIKRIDPEHISALVILVCSRDKPLIGILLIRRCCSLKSLRSSVNRQCKKGIMFVGILKCNIIEVCHPLARTDCNSSSILTAIKSILIRSASIISNLDSTPPLGWNLIEVQVGSLVESVMYWLRCRGIEVAMYVRKARGVVSRAPTKDSIQEGPTVSTPALLQVEGASQSTTPKMGLEDA
jgi:hypothetical protein